MKIHISDDDKPNSDEENGESGSTIQSSAKSGISSVLTQENIFKTLDDLESFGNETEYQKRLDELSPPLRKAYFAIRYHTPKVPIWNVYPKPQVTSSNITVNEVSCLETKVDQQPEQVETQPIVQQVVSLSAENKEKNKRKRKSEAAQVSLSGVVAKLNECFNEINSVWAQNPRNTSLSLIPAEILKVRELVSDELEKFAESED